MKQNYLGMITKIGSSIFILITVLFSSCSKGDSPQPIPPVIPPVIATPKMGTFSPTSAEAGKEIIITGTLFGTNLNAVVVKFADGASVIPKSVTPTQITVTVPSTAKTGQITVIVNNVTSLTTNESFILLVSNPTVTGFSPSSVNAGESVTITGTNFGNDINSVTITLATGNVIKPKTVTNTQITFDAPATFGAGQLTLSISSKTPIKIAGNLTIVNNNPVYEDIALTGCGLTVSQDHKELIVANFTVQPLSNVKYDKGGDITMRIVNVNAANFTINGTSTIYTKEVSFSNRRVSTGSSVQPEEAVSRPYLEFKSNSMKDPASGRPLIKRYFFTDNGVLSSKSISIKSTDAFANDEFDINYFLNVTNATGLKLSL